MSSLVCCIDHSIPTLRTSLLFLHLITASTKGLGTLKLNLCGNIIVVGDGYTDYEIKKCGVADTFIAFTENISRQSVIEKADIVANNFNTVITEFMK